MSTQTLKVTAVANGGAAVAHDAQGQTIFVPYAIPGETVEVQLGQEKSHYNQATLLRVIQAVPERVSPRCPHFGVCGGCQWQHMSYDAQLLAKQAIVSDQMQRIGGLKNVTVRPTLPHPTPWHYRHDLSLSPTSEGGYGLWSPSQHQVIPIESCPILHEDLLTLLQDIDLELPGLRKLTLRIGDDGALLAALEVDDIEPPELEVDFPLSVAIVLPDKTAASLIGDNYTVQSVKGRDFRVSPGCVFHISPPGAALVVETLLAYAQLSGQETVLELYSGVGTLTAFLAEAAAQIVAVEVNEDAVADTAVNLADFDNVSLYQGWVEDVLPALDIAPDLVVLNPPDPGLSKEALHAVTAVAASRLIYISSDIATFARDAKHLTRAGYHLAEIQPVDTQPQTYRMETVSLWTR
ncbi:MAG: class I SAM-dependent RNA methyltransferase [Anaerolineales bacterium]|nr:class I SAM-dependent RNA methyltransferase [Anaerolineales bacterium]